MVFKQEYIRFNLNYNIRVRIKEKGYQRLADHYNKWHNTHPNIFEMLTIEELKGRADKDGYTKFQMYNFVEIFGGEDMFGNGIVDYYDINILLHTQDM